MKLKIQKIGFPISGELERVDVQLDKHTVLDIINEAIENFRKVKDFKANVIVSIFDNDDESMLAYLKQVGDNKFQLAFTKISQRYLTKEIICKVCYHELCHLVQLKILEDNRIAQWNSSNNCVSLFAKTDENKKMFEAELIKDSGHGPLWLTIKQYVESKLKVDIPISETVIEETMKDTFLFKGFFDDFTYLLHMKEIN